jgi:L-ascorbate metabolism protein UlaG (beta-lactamase superfamily)
MILKKKADILLITHSHYDHCSHADLNKIIKPGTNIVVTADAQSKVIRFNIPVKVEIIEKGAEIGFPGNIKVLGFPAYNIDKNFHSKEEGWIGYLIKVNGLVVYHAGDTDLIPEMQKLTGFSSGQTGEGKKLIALLPVGGRFTMNVEEAVEAAKLIKPWLAIPMHFGSIVGADDDAQEFVDLCKEEGIEARILERE